MTSAANARRSEVIGDSRLVAGWWRAIWRVPNLFATLVALAIVSYFVIVPLITILVSSLKPQGLPNTPGWTLGHISSVFLAGDTYHLIGNTLIFAFGSVVFAVAVGFASAWFIERTDVPGRQVLRMLILVQIAVPKILIAMGWILLLAPRVGLFNALFAHSADDNGPFHIYSMGGMIFVNGLALSPMAFLLSSPVFARMSMDLEEAAVMSGAGYVQILRRVILPVLWPAILAAFSYLFILSVVIFDIPALIGLPARIFVLSSAIYDAALPGRGLPDYGQIAALSLITLILALILVFYYIRVIRDPNRFVSVTGRGYRVTPVLLRGWRPVVFLVLLAYCFLVVLLPVSAIAFASLQPYWSALTAESLSRLTVENYVNLAHTPSLWGALRNSAIVGVVAATAVTLLGFLISWVVVRTKSPLRGLIDGLAVLPNGMPGVIVGVSMLIFYLTWGNFIPIYGTIWVLVAAYITDYMAYATRVTNSSLLQIHAELEEAAEMSGAGKLITMWRIVIPLVIPALAGVWIWAFTVSLRNVSTALLLAGRDNRVYGVELWTSWTKGAYNSAAAMGVVLIGVIIVVQLAMLMFRNTRRRLIVD